MTRHTELVVLQEAQATGALKLGPDDRVYPQGDSEPVCTVATADSLTRQGLLQRTSKGWRLTGKGAASITKHAA
jgi:hypothetical protein